jgi:dTDP-4-dehydrorhamnose reductase
VTGCAGLLGQSLLPALEKRYKIVGIGHKAGGAHSALVVDVSQRAETMRSIIGIAPQVVVHAAAQTDVDYCELHKDLARKVNVDGTRNVADACERIRANLVFISTDYVFDGAKGNYVESDRASPINFYGLTKLEGERIAAASSNSLVIRSSVLYGWHPSKLNFVTWILQGLRKQENLRVACDQFNSPTFAMNLALVICKAIDSNINGILHVGGSERISRFEFAQKIAKKFDLDRSFLIPIKMEKLNWIAKRPRDSSLDSGKAEKDFGLELYGVDRGLEEMVKTKPRKV